MIASKYRWPAMVVVVTLLGAVAPFGLPRAVVAAVLASPTLTSPLAHATASANPVFAWTLVADAVKYRIEISQNPGFSPTVVADETQNLRYAPATELPLGTLYWRVAARDAGNVLGDWAQSSFTKQWGSAPNPLTPSDGALLSFPTDPLLFTWQPLPGAQSYELQVDDGLDFIGALTYPTKNTSYVITDPKTSGQSIHYRVRAVSGGIYSDYSPARVFTVEWPSTPQLVSPANGETVTDVEFDWEPVAGAKTYQLEVSPNGDWANNVTFSVMVKGTRYSRPASLNNGSYFWRVRAIDSAANNGLWSAERQFNRSWTLRPELLEPANGAVGVDELTFSWGPVAHASYYQVQWSTDPNFLTSVTCYTNHTTVTPYAAIVGGGEPGACDLSVDPGATIYWHVRGIDPPVHNPGAGEPGVLGLWSNASVSDVWSFVYLPGTPAPVAPANGTTLEVPTLSWADVLGASRYRVTIVDKNGVTISQDTYSTSFTPTATLITANSPFRWYVRTYDYAGSLGAIPPEASWSSFTLVPIATTYTAPDQLAPVDGTASVAMPSLVWQPVTGATSYKVWYSPNGAVYSQLGSSTAYPAYTYPTSVLATGTYHWYVEAFNGGTKLSESTGVPWTFIVQSPDLIPTDGYTTPATCLPASPCAALADTPTLTWDAVPGALSYRVYVAYDPNFTNIYRTYDTTWTRLTPRESYVDNQAGQAFYWFVRPIRSGNTGRFDSAAHASASAFHKRSEPIALQAPLSGTSTPDEINFRWDSFLQTNQALTEPVDQEAKQYRIQVSQVTDFATTIDTQLVDQTFYTPHDRTYPEGPVYWRVQAVDNSGNSLTMSASRLTTKASLPVVLSYPADGASLPGVPYLRWSAQAYAASYTVQLDNDGNLSSPIVTTTTAMTAWAYGEPLAAGTYFWRVRRNDADNRPGPWSQTRSFSLSPSAPTLLSPAQGANPSPASLLLQWTASQPSPKYSVELSTVNTFTSQVGGFPQATVMSAWAPKTLLTNGTYYWRVKALNAAGTAVATSAVFSFSIDSSRPSVSSLTPASSAAITAAFTVTFSEPVIGVDESAFKVTVAGTTAALSGTINVLSTTQARFTPSAPLVPGQTYTAAVSSAVTDVGGNPLLPYSANVRTSTTVQESSVAVRETWARWSTGSASGGALKLSRRASSKLAFAFTGTSIGLVGYKGTSGGYASVYLDGVLQTGSASFYAASGQHQATIWSKSGLAAGQHRLEVVVKGTKPTASKDAWVYVDGFLVDGNPVQENAASVTDRFRRVSTTRASGSAYDVLDHRTATGRSAPTLSFQFKGTGISWIGTKGPGYGKAAVYIDNVKKATIDLYASSTAYRVKLWTSATLSNGVHTIKVVILGSKRTASKGYDVSFDAFTIK